MFRKLCGSDSLKNMMIVTNMWSVEVTEEEQNRERQLRNDARFFKSFMDDHATMVRHDNTLESAHKIIQHICTNHPSVLDIQRETVVEMKTLPSTGAGIALRSGLLEPAQGLQVLAEGLQERMKVARAEGDYAKAAELRSEILELVPSLARLYNELKNLQALTDKEIDVMRVWNNMDPKAQIIAIFRRSCGTENNPELNAFWAALGDTIVFFKAILDVFQEYPLPLSVHEQLLHDTGMLTPDSSEKFDKWFSGNQEGIWDIRARVDNLIASRARPIEGQAHQAEKRLKGDLNPIRKDNILVRVGERIVERMKRSRRRSPEV
jgi:hypothetical protein